MDLIPEKVPPGLVSEAEELESAMVSILGGTSGKKALGGLPPAQRRLLFEYLKDSDAEWRTLCERAQVSVTLATILKQSHAWDAVQRWQIRRAFAALTHRLDKVAEKMVSLAIEGDTQAAALVFKAGRLLTADDGQGVQVPAIQIVNKFQIPNSGDGAKVIDVEQEKR